MESDSAFYRRRLRGDTRLAHTLPHDGLRSLHARWAQLYRDRLNRCARGEPAELTNVTIGGAAPRRRRAWWWTGLDSN